MKRRARETRGKGRSQKEERELVCSAVEKKPYAEVRFTRK